MSQTLHTYATFIVRFPEFSEVPQALVDAILTETANEVDPAVCGNMTDAFHGNLTAHKLCLNPGGREARLQKNSSKTTYSEELARLQTLLGGGYGIT